MFCIHGKIHFIIESREWEIVFLSQYGNGTCLMQRIKEFEDQTFDKTNKMTVRPAKTQISLGIRPLVLSRVGSIYKHPPRLIRVFALRSVGSYGPKLSSCRQRRLWSDWADAQADLSFRWVHMPFCWFRHELAQFYKLIGACKSTDKKWKRKKSLILTYLPPIECLITVTEFSKELPPSFKFWFFS